MKNTALMIGALGLFFLTSCEKKTTTTVEGDGSTTTVETVGFDEERIDSTAQNVKEGVKDAAQKTGAALETAGEKLKEGAQDAEQDIKEATDGDGDANR